MRHILAAMCSHPRGTISAAPTFDLLGTHAAPVPTCPWNQPHARRGAGGPRNPAARSLNKRSTQSHVVAYMTTQQPLWPKFRATEPCNTGPHFTRDLSRSTDPQLAADGPLAASCTRIVGCAIASAAASDCGICPGVPRSDTSGILSLHVSVSPLTCLLESILVNSQLTAHSVHASESAISMSNFGPLKTGIVCLFREVQNWLHISSSHLWPSRQ
jgi:hypothetical protein